MHTTDYKAFVSSTYLDLKDHRAAVIRELRDAGFLVDPMENWTSAADEPKELSTRRLEGCHLCVLLIARRRGHVPAGAELSITQMEYEEAKRRHIDVLPFLLDDDADGWPAGFDELASDERLRKWLADVKEHHIVQTFKKTPSTLHIAPALTRWVKETGPKVALRLYLDCVQQEHGFIRFVSLPRLEDNPNAPIQRLYVEPAVAPRWVSPDVDPAEWPATQPLLDAVAEHKRLVLLGDPGSGKSTLVSWIAWQLARHHHDGTSPWTERLGRLVPLPMILRDLGIGPGVTWDKLLDAFIQQPMGKMLTLTNLRKLLEDGQAVIMLDGLDEIGSPAIRRDLRDAIWIHWESEKEPDNCCRWLLTSRIVRYDEMPFDYDKRYDEESERHFTTRYRVSYAEQCYVAPFDDPQLEYPT